MLQRSRKKRTYWTAGINTCLYTLWLMSWLLGCEYATAAGGGGGACFGRINGDFLRSGVDARELRRDTRSPPPALTSLFPDANTPPSEVALLIPESSVPETLVDKRANGGWWSPIILFRALQAVTSSAPQRLTNGGGIRSWADSRFLAESAASRLGVIGSHDWLYQLNACACSSRHVCNNEWQTLNQQS